MGILQFSSLLLSYGHERLVLLDTQSSLLTNILQLTIDAMNREVATSVNSQTGDDVLKTQGEYIKITVRTEPLEICYKMALQQLPIIFNKMDTT